MPVEHESARVRIGDLRRAHVADSTLENLLLLLTSKIQDCSRLAVYEYEAGTQGHASCATAFRSLATLEREGIESILACLREYLAEMPTERVAINGVQRRGHRQ